jgi:hypothetical protein
MIDVRGLSEEDGCWARIYPTCTRDYSVFDALMVSIIVFHN